MRRYCRVTSVLANDKLSTREDANPLDLIMPEHIY